MKEVSFSSNKKTIRSYIVVVFLLLTIFTVNGFYKTEKSFVFNREGATEDSAEVEIVSGDGLSQDNNPAEEIEEEILEKDLDNLNPEDSETNLEEDQLENLNETEDLASEQANLSQGEFPGHSADQLKIGFITDLHVISNEGSGGKSLEKYFVDRINYFVDKMNNSFGPDFIIINGDVIEGTKVPEKIGVQELLSTKRLFDNTKIKKYWVIGNHDLRSLTKSTWKKTLGIDYLGKAFEAGNYKIIILDSNFDQGGKDVSPENSYTRGNVSSEQIKFLKKEIKNTDKKVIVFAHHPFLWDVDVKLNDNLPLNSQEMREIFSKNEVLAVFGGHIEDFYLKKTDGVNYFVSPGILKHPKYPGTFSEITIDGNDLVIDSSYLGKYGKYITIRIE